MISRSTNKTHYFLAIQHWPNLFLWLLKLHFIHKHIPFATTCHCNLMKMLKLTTCDNYSLRQHIHTYRECVVAAYRLLHARLSVAACYTFHLWFFGICHFHFKDTSSTAWQSHCAFGKCEAILQPLHSTVKKVLLWTILCIQTYIFGARLF